MAESVSPPSAAAATPVTTPPAIQRRSSSQTSTSSRRSQKSKGIRAKPPKRLSACSSSTHTPTDLTSFPSLTPDHSPEGFRGEPALNHALSQALLAEESNGQPARTTNGNSNHPHERGRQATLAGLVGSAPPASGRTALFDDSMLTREVPGSLHLANDDHIERMIARIGAVKLIRQFARDLALRDAEISALRFRADERERELKKMLREVQVSNLDIERRLYVLENPVNENSNHVVASDPADKPRGVPSTSSLDDMMNQAMEDNVGTKLFGDNDIGRDDLQATIRPHRYDSDTRSGSSQESAKKKALGSLRGIQDYFWGGSTTVSRKTSGASSVISEADEHTERDASATLMGAPRRPPLDDQLFQPPESNATKLANGRDDGSSIQSHKSSASITSWTVRLFAGNSTRERLDRPRSTTPNSRDRSSSPNVARATSGSAVAALKRLNGPTGVQSLSRKSSAASSVKGPARSNVLPPTSATSAARHVSVSGASQTPRSAPDSTRASRSDSSSHGPVEMDAILPMESRPPTLTYIYGNHTSGDLPTDRYGFIYDQRRNRRQREANYSRRDAEDEVAEPQESNVADDSQSANVAVNADEGDTRSNPLRLWQDYLKIATKHTELLSHTPAAAPVVQVEPAEAKPRIPSVSIDKRGSLSVANSTSQPSASTSNVISNHAEFASVTGDQVATESPAAQDQEPVKLLLHRLTEIHDASQRERTVKWNEFMRKVRAERQKEGEAAASLAPERAMASLTMPEASLADGEVVGIAGLGNKGKVGRAKWREFKNLVLGGIPVAYRAKIWAECSGANALRVPGYYDELVKGSTPADADPEIVAQIDMDIHRTLTDNVFFRKGPGVAKLKEVLLAYSRRNPEVGYCQGMNLIAGSLLLIMPTAEDAFWILTSIIENILPPHYYDHGLFASRADQQVLRQYVAEVLPTLSEHLDALGIELEALTFQWFLSVFTDCLSAEALYRVWDVVLCLGAPNTATLQKPAPVEPGTSVGTTASASAISNAISSIGSSAANASQDTDPANSGFGSTFFFQVALALLKLNEQQLLTTCHTPAAVYTYINHQMTNHAISIDGLIQASEALRNVVKREDVLVRRAAAMTEMRARQAGYAGSSSRGTSVNDTDV
jgi:hypothetical protein